MYEKNTYKNHTTFGEYECLPFKVSFYLLFCHFSTKPITLLKKKILKL